MAGVDRSVCVCVCLYRGELNGGWSLGFIHLVRPSPLQPAVWRSSPLDTHTHTDRTPRDDDDDTGLYTLCALVYSPLAKARMGIRVYPAATHKSYFWGRANKGLAAAQHKDISKRDLIVFSVFYKSERFC